MVEIIVLFSAPRLCTLRCYVVGLRLWLSPPRLLFFTRCVFVWAVGIHQCRTLCSSCPQWVSPSCGFVLSVFSSCLITAFATIVCHRTMIDMFALSSSLHCLFLSIILHCLFCYVCHGCILASIPLFALCFAVELSLSCLLLVNRHPCVTISPSRLTPSIMSFLRVAIVSCAMLNHGAALLHSSSRLLLRLLHVGGPCRTLLLSVSAGVSFQPDCGKTDLRRTVGNVPLCVGSRAASNASVSVPLRILMIFAVRSFCQSMPS